MSTRLMGYAIPLLMFVTLLIGCQPSSGPYYEIMTTEGPMVVRLYDETPIHRDNFKKLAAERYYDGTLFHRAVAGFIIQGGDPNSRDDEDPLNDGLGGPDTTLLAEINPLFFHKRGALAAARLPDRQNPARRSNGSQFYLVQGGNGFSDDQIRQVQQQLRQRIPNPDFAFSDSAWAAYRTEGGAPFLDMQYTVFGELVEGFDVLDRLAVYPTPSSRPGPRVHPSLAERPHEPVSMTIRPLPDYGK